MIERVVRGRDCPWLNNSTKLKMRERDFLLKKARRTGNEFDWILYRKARNATTRAIKSSKANYNRTVLSENLSRPKQFWNRIKKCYHTKNTASSTPKSFQINDKVRDITKLHGYPRSNVKTRLKQSNLFLASGRFPLQNAIYDNKLPFSRM